MSPKKKVITETSNISDYSDSEELSIKDDDNNEEENEEELNNNEEEDDDNNDEEESEKENEEENEEETVDETENDECLYNKAKVKNIDLDEEDDEIEIFYDDDNIKYNEIVKPEDRITKPFMTIFERVRIIGDRAKQLSLGAKPMIKNLEITDPKEIAKLELEKKVIPLIIERELPNGKKERWRVSELQIVN